jgi:hypothetical protein
MPRQRTFPNPHNSPPKSVKSTIGSTVAPPIHRYLVAPRGSIPNRCEVSTTLMTVPKATVHKHGNLRGWKNEIRFAKQGKLTSPTAQSGRAQE